MHQTDAQLTRAEKRAKARAERRRAIGSPTGINAASLADSILAAPAESFPPAVVVTEWDEVDDQRAVYVPPPIPVPADESLVIFRPEPDPPTDELTPGQRAAVEGIVSLVAEAIPTTVLLSGAAGTGKTHTLKALLERLEEIGIDRSSVVLAAPTHKAVGQMIRALDWPDDANEASVQTVARLLGLKRVLDMAKGEKVFKPGGTLLPIDARVLVIDEASMLSDDHLTWIRDVGALAVVVFIGDPAQLPPIDGNAKAEHGPVFNDGAVEHRFHLDQVMRHDGQVLALATAVREQRLGFLKNPAELLSDDVADEGSRVITLAAGDFHRQMRDLFLSDEAMRDPDHARALAFTNATVDALTKTIRTWRYGPGAKRFEPGEILTALDAIPFPWDDDSPLISNNAEICVVEATDELVENPHVEGETWLATRVLVDLIDRPNAATGDQFRINVLHPSEFGRFNRLQGETRTEANKATKSQRRALLNAIYQRQAGFAKVGYSTALTIHKAQGSTFRNVFLLDDFSHRRDRRFINQLGYVATTRASETLYLRSINK